MSTSSQAQAGSTQGRVYSSVGAFEGSLHLKLLRFIIRTTETLGYPITILNILQIILLGQSLRNQSVEAAAYLGVHDLFSLKNLEFLIFFDEGDESNIFIVELCTVNKCGYKGLLRFDHESGRGNDSRVTYVEDDFSWGFNQLVNCDLEVVKLACKPEVEQLTLTSDFDNTDNTAPHFSACTPFDSSRCSSVLGRDLN